MVEKEKGKGKGKGKEEPQGQGQGEGHVQGRVRKLKATVFLRVMTKKCLLVNAEVTLSWFSVQEEKSL